MSEVKTPRARALSLDHLVLLLLLNGKALDGGLTQTEILEGLRKTGGIGSDAKPYSSLRNRLDRLRDQGLCTCNARRWTVPAAAPGMGPTFSPFLKSFLVCGEFHCTRDHFPDLILSDYALRSVPGEWGWHALLRVLAKVLIWEASRTQGLRAHLNRWRDDILARAPPPDARPDQLGIFRAHVTGRFEDLAKILTSGSFADRIAPLTEWIGADRRLATGFFAGEASWDEIQVLPMASPTFWRYALLSSPLFDRDFTPITPPEGTGGRVLGVAIHPRSRQAVRELRLGPRAFSIFQSFGFFCLKKDMDQLPGVARRLQRLGKKVDVLTSTDGVIVQVNGRSVASYMDLGSSSRGQSL